MNKMCEKCGKYPATFHYRENIAGVKKEIHLCAHCAEEQKLGAFFSMEKGASFPLYHSIGKKTSSAVCPRCGMTLARVRGEGVFGCSACYDAFAPSLDMTPFVGTGYRGEGKKAEEKTASPKTDPVEKWKKELKKAVQEENYELAAKLRDRIREKEGK